MSEQRNRCTVRLSRNWRHYVSSDLIAGGARSQQGGKEADLAIAGRRRESQSSLSISQRESRRPLREIKSNGERRPIRREATGAFLGRSFYERELMQLVRSFAFADCHRLGLRLRRRRIIEERRTNSAEQEATPPPSG